MGVVAITGASGFIGRHLVTELLRLGNIEIRVLSRTARNDFAENGAESKISIIEGDINDPVSVRSLLTPGCTVINLVYQWNAGEAVNLAVTNCLLDACIDAKVARLIHCSTAAVSGRVPDEKISEQTLCRPITKYGITKLKIEQIILEKSRGKFEAVILRPTSVFGIGGDPLKKLAGDLLSGSHLKNFVKSCLFGTRRMNLVHVNNVVAAMVFLMSTDAPLDGEIFIVSDDDAKNNNFARVEQKLMQVLDISDYPLPRLSLPLGLLSLILTLLGRNNTNPRCTYDASKLFSLGFKRPVDFDAGLTEYATWYRSAYLETGRDDS